MNLRRSLQFNRSETQLLPEDEALPEQEMAV